MIDKLIDIKDQTLYAAVVVCVLACLTIGFLVGYREPADICSEYVVKLDREKEDHLKTNDELTQCKAKLAGGKVLDCVSVCDKRVKEALEKKKEWICND